MAARGIHPVLKLILEIGPIGVFFLAYQFAPVDAALPVEQQNLEQILFATLVFMPSILLAVGTSWLLTGKLPRLAAVTAVVVLVFGALTLILRDDTFIKMKPTINYCLLAGALGFGLLRGTSFLKYLLEEMIPMRDEGWMKLTVRFVAFYLVMAVVNEIVWRTTSTDLWVSFRTFVLPAANFVFVMSQMPLFARYALPEGETRS